MSETLNELVAPSSAAYTASASDHLITSTNNSQILVFKSSYRNAISSNINITSINSGSIINNNSSSINSKSSSNNSNNTNIPKSGSLYPRKIQFSKKNVVLSPAFSNEKTSLSGNELALFEIAKVDENAFAVDFRNMSPLQAFAIAISVFYES